MPATLLLPPPRFSAIPTSLLVALLLQCTVHRKHLSEGHQIENMKLILILAVTTGNFFLHCYGTKRLIFLKHFGFLFKY